jgi:hypothetical protein
MDTRPLFIGNGVASSSSTRPYKTGSFLQYLAFIHYFDAHRLQPQLLEVPELQLHPRASNLTGPEGAGDTVEDPSSDEERATTDGDTDVEDSTEEEPWCPPIPNTPDDPTEAEIAGAADKLETMMNSSQPHANVFFQPDSLGALRALWLQAKLTISLTSMQDKFAGWL